MNIIPLIYFQKGKIYTEKNGEILSVEDLLASIDKDTELYIYDKDGIDGDKPNLGIYPKLSEHCKIWVDWGPRSLGDVVDAVMAGATSVTIRKNLWPKLDVSGIREFTESNVFEMINSQTITNKTSPFSSSVDIDGFVIFSEKDRFKRDVIFEEDIKNICKRFNISIIESDYAFFSFWKNIGVTTLLIELNTWKKVKHREF